MRVLIVEDEPGARDGLYRLLVTSFSTWEILPPCKNGNQGIESIRSSRPDIIVTDIRMSSGDGLEMIQRMHDESLEAAIIILSGYPDFEIARQCLALGVQDYLVKPVAVDEIISALLKAENDRFSSNEFQQRLDGVALPEITEGFLYYFKTREPLAPSEKQTLKLEIRKVLPSRSRLQAVENPRGEYLFLSPGGEPPNRRDQQSLLDVLRGRLKKQVIGCAIEVKGHPIPVTVEVLKKSAKRFLVHPVPGFFIVVPNSATALQPVKYSHNHERAFVDAFHSSESPDLRGLFREVCLDYAREECDPVEAIDCLKRFLFFVQNFIKDVDQRRFLALLEQDPVIRLKSSLDFSEVLEVFDNLAAIIGHSEQDSPLMTDEYHIQRALAQIENDPQTSLSLEQVAERLGISAQYLSRRFKARLGVGFAQYQSQRRIEHAKRLLSDLTEPIGSVAQKAGFATQKYFCVCFKKETGFTPSEYRQRYL